MYFFFYPLRYQYLYDGKMRFKSDGLNSAKYKPLDIQLRRLYTWVYVDLYPSWSSTPSGHALTCVYN